MVLTQPAVEARGLVKRFGNITAVAGVDLHVEVGEVYGILGPNGAGKTTFLRMLFGLIRPDAGDLRIFGRSWSEAGPRALDGVAGFVETLRFYPLPVRTREPSGSVSASGVGARGDNAGLDSSLFGCRPPVTMEEISEQGGRPQ